MPVKISVQYPSKKVKKTISSEYEMLGKSIAHGLPSQIANAVMKCKPIKQACCGTSNSNCEQGSQCALLEKESIIISTSKKED